MHVGTNEAKVANVHPRVMLCQVQSFWLSHVSLRLNMTTDILYIPRYLGIYANPYVGTSG